MEAAELHYEPKGRRDPFVPLVGAGSSQKSGSLLAVETPEDLIVEGIACDAEKGCIVIANGTVLREGEGSGSVKVVRIGADTATFLVNEMEVVKQVYQEDDQVAEAMSSNKL